MVATSITIDYTPEGLSLTGSFCRDQSGLAATKIALVIGLCQIASETEGLPWFWSSAEALWAWQTDYEKAVLEGFQDYSEDTVKAFILPLVQKKPSINQDGLLWLHAELERLTRSHSLLRDFCDLTDSDDDEQNQPQSLKLKKVSETVELSAKTLENCCQELERFVAFYSKHLSLIQVCRNHLPQPV